MYNSVSSLLLNSWAYRIASSLVSNFFEALDAPDFRTAHPEDFDGTTWLVLLLIFISLTQK
jgi:hypothetical protein